MKVTTWSLQMFRPAPQPSRPFPERVRLDRADGMTPEYARFLYGLVGGDWYWTDRLAWTRPQWADELAVPGTEFWILYRDGVPAGYVQLQPVVQPGGTEVEIRYFGLAAQAIGHGLGGPLLEHGLAAAWSLAERSGLPAVARVWVHTCSLDGPAALANYQARGLVVYAEDVTDQAVPARSPGPWAATTGLPPAGELSPDVVTGRPQQPGSLIQPVSRDQDDVAVVARNRPDRQAAGRQRRHDRAQHPGRLYVMRLVTVPQRRPGVLAGVVAPDHGRPVRAEHHGEQVRARDNLGDVGRALENVGTVEHPHCLLAGRGHRQLAPLLWARPWSCRACTSATQSQPSWADGPTRGSGT